MFLFRRDFICDSASLPLLNVPCGAILDSHPFLLFKGYGRGRAYAAGNVVVIDESHRLRTTKTCEDDCADGADGRAQDMQAVLQLIRKAPQETPVALLSGTPNWNSTVDVFNQVHLLRPGKALLGPASGLSQSITLKSRDNLALATQVARWSLVRVLHSILQSGCCLTSFARRNFQRDPSNAHALTAALFFKSVPFVCCHNRRS